MFTGMAVTNVSAVSFAPRLTAPDYNNPYYIHSSYGGLNDCIHISGGSCLPNCVGYAWGRAYEILGTRPNLARTHAYTWYSHNINNGYYSYGSTPRIGSIMCWKGGTEGGHVAVVEKIENGVITISESNYGGARFVVKSGTQSEIESHARNFQGYIYLGDFSIIPPTNPQISKSQVWYDLGDTIDIFMSANGATSYYMSMFKDGEKIIGQNVDSGKFSMSASAYGIGDYSVYFSGSNSAGTVDSSWINFSVVGEATYSNIYTSKDVYDIKDTISITVDTVCAKGQCIGIDKENYGRVITEDCNSTYTIKASDLGVGSYSAYFSVYNGSGGVDTKRVKFRVIEFKNLGDANGDGEVNIQDATLVQMFVAKYKVDNFNEKLADCDQSGAVNIQDATAIQMKVAKLA